jgi:hypothetical protein
MGNIACNAGSPGVPAPHPIKPGIMHLQTDIGIAYFGDSLRKGGSRHALGGAEEQINSDSVPARTLVDQEARQCDITREADNNGNQPIQLSRAVPFVLDWRSQGAGPANSFATSISHGFR